MTTIRPVINIRRKAPGAKPVKFARVTFPEIASPLDVVATMHRFPLESGFLCDLRQVGPQGFSEPLDLAVYFKGHPGLAQYVGGMVTP